MKKLNLLLGILLAGIAISCQSNTYDEIGGYVDVPSYEKNIKPIFDGQCIKCHYQNNPSSIGGGTEIYDYQTTVDNINYSLRDIDTTFTMPKSGAKLSKTKIKLLYAWKNTGFNP